MPSSKVALMSYHDYPLTSSEPPTVAINEYRVIHPKSQANYSTKSTSHVSMTFPESTARLGCQGDLKPGKERDQGVTGTDLLHLTPFEAPSQSPHSQPTKHIHNSISSPYALWHTRNKPSILAVVETICLMHTEIAY
jgi:hypothetical protein